MNTTEDYERELLVRQEPFPAHPPDLWDVVIVGAGPAGSVAAINLASQGHRTLLLDRKEFPRNKTCGDGLLPDSLRALQRVGLEEEIRRLGYAHKTISVFSPGGIEFGIPGDFVIIRRFLLDALMARRAQVCGATFCQGYVLDFSAEVDGSVRFQVAGIKHPVRSRTALIATGASVNLLIRHGMVRRQPHDAFAIRCYVRSTAKLEHMTISLQRPMEKGDYGWIFPMGNHEYNVGCCLHLHSKSKGKTNMRKMFHRFCRSFLPLRSLMQEAVYKTQLKGAPLRGGLNGVCPVGPGNMLAIGETIGTTSLLTGEGIGKAMETGELAAATLHEALSSGDFRCLADFETKVHSELDHKYIGPRIVRFFHTFPRTVEFIARHMTDNRFFQEALEGLVYETIEARTIFSLKGLLRLLRGREE